MKTTKLKALGACANARAFARRKKSYQEGWEKNKRVDWALWLLCHASNAHYLMAIGLVIEFTERALHLRPGCDSHESIEAARAYSRDPSVANREACSVVSVQFPSICVADACLRDDPHFGFGIEFTVDAMYTIATRAARILGEGEERHWQMARILEVCPVCPISEEGK